MKTASQPRDTRPGETAPDCAFAALYDQNIARVYRYHLARTGSPTDAEDLAAETFFAALQSFHRLREDEPPTPWLMGIARHKLADHFRRTFFRRLAGRPARRSVPLDALPDLPLPGASLEEQAGARLELEQVLAALRSLNQARGEALALHYFAGLPLAEVARVMGRSEEACKKLVQRGLAELRERLLGGAPVLPDPTNPAGGR